MGESEPLLISCREAVRQLWEYLDGAAVEQGSVAEHLAFCRRCCGELEFIEHLRELLAAQATGEDERDLPVRRLERFVEEL